MFPESWTISKKYWYILAFTGFFFFHLKAVIMAYVDIFKKGWSSMNGETDLNITVTFGRGWFNQNSQLTV